jgi:hypothetical protein
VSVTRVLFHADDALGRSLGVPGRVRQGHLHHDINTGHVEYLDPDTGAPAPPGGLATVVVAPYFPYRDCMPVFRYDTRGLVRRLPDETLSCETAGQPASSKVRGKADQVVHVGEHLVITPRELIEAVQALPSRPWPARFGAVVGRRPTPSDAAHRTMREFVQSDDVVRHAAVPASTPAGVAGVPDGDPAGGGAPAAVAEYASSMPRPGTESP